MFNTSIFKINNTVITNNPLRRTLKRNKTVITNNPLRLGRNNNVSLVNPLRSIRRQYTLKQNNGRRYLTASSDYLDTVSIFGESSIIKTDLVQSLFNNLNIKQKPDLKNIILTAISAVYALESNCINTDKWIPCLHNCESILSKLIKAEIESTAYILRTLTKSIITVDGGFLEFFINGGPLTGIWKNDAQYISINKLGNTVRNGRLILGLGPSASGKTYWAESLIKLISSVDDNFPKTFISIDGGIYRESSIVYQYIIEQTKQFCITGLSNLVLSTWTPGQKSLFDAGKIKSNIISYLQIQSETNPISLYVPETLGDCGDRRFKGCYGKYKKYIDITNDLSWIGILIWQHKTASQCVLRSNYKCRGCTESGKARERIEGKQYSNASYEHSMIEGNKVLDQAPGGSYMIHNSGSKMNKSIIEDYTEYTINGDTNIQNALSHNDNMKKYNYIYFVAFKPPQQIPNWN